MLKTHGSVKRKEINCWRLQLRALSRGFDREWRWLMVASRQEMLTEWDMRTSCKEEAASVLLLLVSSMENGWRTRAAGKLTKEREIVGR
ncbi:hypothetical protein ACJRO7_026421 [Eucalyptus globulus]|uniref:Uncharacterized protein n=1 Tax=Eucalyptus globulus TaxID=34317 RepID=A0ABD3JRM2_EUCGL